MVSYYDVAQGGKLRKMSLWKRASATQITMLRPDVEPELNGELGRARADELTGGRATLIAGTGGRRHLIREAHLEGLRIELHHLFAIHRALQFMPIHIRRPPRYTVHRAATVPPGVP